MNSNNVEYLKIAQLEPFPNHPFKVIENEDFEVLINSIRDHGITSPLLVWETEDGQYILMSGHRRATASEFLSFTDERFAVVPCIIYRGLTLEEATIIMVDENARREKLLPSEKAWAYRMKLEAMKRKAGRPNKTTCAPMEHKLENGAPMEHHFETEHFEKAKSRVLIGKDRGDSGEQVRRYIRLTYLINALLQYVDDGKLGFRAGVELSYLPNEEQNAVLQKIRETQKFPTLKQASLIKQAFQANELTYEDLHSILTEFTYGDRVSFRVSAAQRQQLEDMSANTQKSKSEILRTLSKTGKAIYVGQDLIDQVTNISGIISHVGNLLMKEEESLRVLANDPYIYTNDKQAILNAFSRNTELYKELTEMRKNMQELCDKMKYEISKVNSNRQI